MRFYCLKVNNHPEYDMKDNHHSLESHCIIQQMSFFFFLNEQRFECRSILTNLVMMIRTPKYSTKKHFKSPTLWKSPQHKEITTERPNPFLIILYFNMQSDTLLRRFYSDCETTPHLSAGLSSVCVCCGESEAAGPSSPS